jgi:hypothetical protein
MLRVDNRLVVATCEEADSNPMYNDIIAENINYMLPPDNNSTPIDSPIELHTPSNILLCFVAQFYMVYLSPFLSKKSPPFYSNRKVTEKEGLPGFFIKSKPRVPTVKLSKRKSQNYPYVISLPSII